LPTFETQDLLAEYGRLHPETRLLVAAFDTVLEELEQPPCHITCIHRTPEDQRRIYTPQGFDLLARMRAGGKGLQPSKLREAQALEQLVSNRPKGRTELEVVGAWAEARPSWHPRWTAVDVRNKTYPLPIRVKAERWLEMRCADVGGRRPWELITEDHGTGPHWHIARRDFAWLKRLESTA
jgi:hypothetical protein